MSLRSACGTPHDVVAFPSPGGRPIGAHSDPRSVPGVGGGARGGGERGAAIYSALVRPELVHPARSAQSGYRRRRATTRGSTIAVRGPWNPAKRGRSPFMKRVAGRHRSPPRFVACPPIPVRPRTGGAGLVIIGSTRDDERAAPPGPPGRYLLRPGGSAGPGYINAYDHRTSNPCAPGAFVGGTAGVATTVRGAATEPGPGGATPRQRVRAARVNPGQPGSASEFMNRNRVYTPARAASTGPRRPPVSVGK